MTDIRLELDRWTFGVPLIFSIGILLVVFGYRIFWLDQSMDFPLYYYFGAVFIFSLITTIVMEVLWGANELGGIVTFIGALFIIPELPLPGEFNFLIGTLGAVIGAHTILYALKTF